MSEAMTNSEIEDVLSSIRRLVAQEVRGPVERLVLTPAQRVPGAPAEAPVLAAVRAVASESGDVPRSVDSPAALALSPAPERAAPPETPAPAAKSAVPMDEAALAQLVALLVREELHGQLGEKITLQVRKLVRAEVARALEERNLLR